MTRARARALENEVTSFLSDILFDPLEAWLLPKSEMLCMIRYQEDPPEDAREVGQTAKSTDEEKCRKEKKAAPGPGHPAPGPDIRPLETTTTATAAHPPSATGPGHPASTPDIRRLAKSRTSGLAPGNLAPSKQRATKSAPLARTSGSL